VVGGNGNLVSRRANLYRDGTPGRKPEVVRLGEVERPGPRRYLCQDLVLAAYLTVLYGDGGVAKSLLALALAVAVAGDSGEWLGRRVEHGRVLYLDFELDAEEQARRVHQLCYGAGLAKLTEDLLYMSAVGHTTREAFEAARGACEDYGVELLIVDSYGMALHGDAVNARDVIGFYQQYLGPLRALGVAVLVIDHQSGLQAGQSYQQKGAFSSVYKGNLARSVIQVEATERGEGTLTVRLRQKKHNFGPLAEPFGAKFIFNEDSVTLEPVELGAAELAEEVTLNATERVKLALEQGPAYPWEIAEFTGLAVKTVKNTLTRLRKRGVVAPTGEMDGRAEQVSLSTPASLTHIRDGDSGTLENDPAPSVPTSQPLYRNGDEDDRRHRVKELFEAPPRWLRLQSAKYLEEGAPERLLKPLAAAVAHELLGNSRRGEEVLEAVREALGGQGGAS
jgi:DNA-binding CsgD family transcriptional regulator